MATTKVSVLITWDIDPNSHLNWAQKRQALQASVNLCQDMEIAATFFCTAKEAVHYADQISEMVNAGHEIACHGLTHGDEEEYDQMPEEMQRRYIEQATHLLAKQTGVSVTAFRGPRVKMSHITLKILAEYGYLTDSSVCSQRLDIFSSNLVNWGWLMAPRLPYRPHKDSAFKQGELDILEVPVSALALPFISTALYVLKLPIMKALFRLLYIESRRNGKPIVYLAHPEEFGPQLWPAFKWADLSPKKLRTHGLMARKYLNESNPELRLEMSRALFAYMSTFSGVHFVTMREYAR